MRVATCDLSSGSGLTANRINQSNASGLYLAFDGCSCSSRPARCYRPLLTFSFHPCGSRAILLEPRTLHQPEKLGNVSKNEYLFTPSIFTVNQNLATLSPAKSIECSSCTAPCRNLVQSAPATFTNIYAGRCFSPIRAAHPFASPHTHARFAVWKSRYNPIVMRGFEIMDWTNLLRRSDLA